MAITEHMSKTETRDFDRELLAAPGVQVSRGVDELMAAMMKAKPPPPRSQTRKRKR